MDLRLLVAEGTRLVSYEVDHIIFNDSGDT